MPLSPLTPRTRTALKIGVGLTLLWSVAAALLFVPPAGWTSADVTTGRHAGYPDLAARVYNVSPENAARFAAAAVARQPGWKIVRSDFAGGTVEATAPGFPSPSDLTITVTPRGRDAAVIVRSRSRWGFADLGANARRVRALQAAMDDKLPRADGDEPSPAVPPAE